MGKALISCVALGGVAIALLAAEAPPAGMKPIEVVYPKPAIACRLVKRLPGIDPWPEEPRGPIMAPEGCRVLSRGRPVTGSDADPSIGELAMITDGDKEATDGRYVELNEGTQWVQIDLGASCRIHCILLWQYFGDRRAYHDVIVLAGNDPEFREGVVTLFNNDRDNSSGMGRGADREYLEHHEGKLIPGRGTVARYVRVYSNGSTADDRTAIPRIPRWKCG